MRRFTIISGLVGLAAGGIAAFAGVIILLASLSSLLSFAFENAGIDRSLAFDIRRGRKRAPQKWQIKLMSASKKLETMIYSMS